MVFTSAATSLRMSCAILVPSRMRAGIRAPVKFYRTGRKEPSPRRHGGTEARRHGGSVRAIHGRERGRPSIEDLHCHFLVLLCASVSPWGKAFVSRVTCPGHPRVVHEL